MDEREQAIRSDALAQAVRCQQGGMCLGISVQDLAEQFYQFLSGKTSAPSARLPGAQNKPAGSRYP